MTRILVVEDEPAIALGLKNDLALEGYVVEVASDGETGLELGRNGNFDLILLDIMLPRKDGLTLCRELRRARVSSAIILLTARAQDIDKVLGLELGADDYVTKPFSPLELNARIKAVLRRTQGERPRRYSFGDVDVDFDRCVVRRGRAFVDLTPLEFKLLSALVHARGRLQTREQLIEQVWGPGTAITDRVVDNHMLNLRRKLEVRPAEPRYLLRSAVSDTGSRIPLNPKQNRDVSRAARKQPIRTVVARRVDMKTRTFLAATVAIGCSIFSPASADDKRAALLMQQGQVKETLLGDFKGAILLYEEAVKEAGGNGRIAAPALLALGRAQERIGAGEARTTYERVVRQFPDQKASASVASVRLKAMGTRKQADVLTPRRIGAAERGEFILSDSLTADGRRLLLIKGRTFVIRDLVTGETSRLAPEPESLEGAIAAPVFSRDGRQIAYNFRPPDFMKGYLRVVSTEPGSSPRTVLATGADIVNLGPMTFSADGRALLVHIVRGDANQPANWSYELAWISVADGAIRQLKSTRFVWPPAPARVDPERMRLSPDGQLLTYSDQVRQDERHVFVMNASTGEQHTVVGMSGVNYRPVWTPDGSRILFASDRNGSWGLWSVAISGGKAAGEPVQVLASFTGQPIAISPSGTLQYVEYVNPGDTSWVVDRVVGGGIHSIAGRSAGWSPDGQSLAFLRRLSLGFQLIVRSIATGSERAYVVEGIGGSTPRWLPDSGALIVGSTSNESGASTFQSVNVTTGAIRPLFAKDTGERVRSAQFAVSADVKSMYLAARSKASAVWTEIVEVELATGTERTAVKLPDPGIPTGQATTGPLDIGMALSPDGTTLAIQSWTDNARQHAQLTTVRVDGGSQHHVFGPFFTFGNTDRLRWTPDGRKLLFFESDGRGTWRVMRVGAEGGQPEVDVELKNFPDSVPTPSLSSNLAPWNLDVSPDGARIIFGAPAQPKTDLWALDNVLAAVR